MLDFKCDTLYIGYHILFDSHSTRFLNAAIYEFSYSRIRSSMSFCGNLMVILQSSFNLTAITLSSIILFKFRKLNILEIMA